MRSRTRLSVALAATLAPGCDDDLLFVPSRGHPTVLVVVLSEAKPLAHVSNAATETGLRRAIPREGRTYAIYYEQTAEELRLPLGWVESVPDGRPIPDGPVEVDLDVGGSWEQLPELPRELRSPRFPWPPPETRCKQLRTSCVALPGAPPSSIGLASPLGGDRILIGLETGEAFIVSPDGATRLEASIPTAAGALAVGQSGDPELWLVGRDRQLAAGSISDVELGALKTHEPLPFDPGERLWLSGSTDRGAVELFSMSLTSSAARYEEGRGWTPVFADGFVGATSGPTAIRSVAWLRRDTAIFFRSEPFLALLYESGTLSNLPPLQAGLDALTLVPNLGLVGGLGGAPQGFFALANPVADSEWVPLPPFAVEFRVHVISPFPGGFLTVGGESFRVLVQYDLEEGWCEPTAFSYPTTPKSFVAVESGTWLLPRVYSDGLIFVTPAARAEVERCPD
ncbi:MAG: hypothetical protein HYV07_32270 [Deltaproteobacteria bacterium]|nr:hypothetical protein [Deltaproteobacteria bacterium]